MYVFLAHPRPSRFRYPGPSLDCGDVHPLLSYFLYSPPSPHGREGAADWIFRSWPALFAGGLAMWLLLKGPLATSRSLVQKFCRLAMFFFLYCGFLYVLKWNPFWKSMFSLGFENRNKAEGFLILVSTLVWLAASFRALFGFRLPAWGFGFGIPALTKNRTPDMKNHPAQPHVRRCWWIGGRQAADPRGCRKPASSG